jgi:Aerotolerance regulator N-terminal
MSLLNPTGLWMLAAAIPVLVAYFLKAPPRPQRISALFLWPRAAGPRHSASKLRRWQRERSLLFELLLVCLAAVSISEPQCGDQTGKHLILIVDGSYSMQATGANGEPAYERARSEAERLMASEQPTAVTLWESGAQPRLLIPARSSTKEAGSALRAWRPSRAPHDLAESIRRVSLNHSLGDSYVVLTDGPVAAEQLPALSIEVKSVGWPSPNLALVGAARTATGVAVSVANLSPSAQSVAVVAGWSGSNLNKTVRLEPGATALVRFETPTDVWVQVRLPPDSLEIDNLVSVAPALTERVRVQLVPGVDAAAAEAFVQAAAASGLVSTGGDVVLRLGPPGSDAEVQLGTQGPIKRWHRPFFMNRSHPLLEEVWLDAAIWAAGENITGRPLIVADNVTLLSQSDNGQLHLNLAVSQSTLRKSEAWPILVSNLVRFVLSQRAGFRVRQAALGSEVEFQGEGGQYAVRSPTGTVVEAQAGRVEVDAVGQWQLLHQGNIIDRLEVGTLSAVESNLGSRGPYSLSRQGTVGPAATTTRPFAWALLAALLVLLVVHFWLHPEVGALRGLSR